jgi:hypothetical protein
MKFILDLARLLSMVQSRELYRIDTLYSAALGSFVMYLVIQLPPQIQVSVKSIVCCEKLLAILWCWEEDRGISSKGEIKS